MIKAIPQTYAGVRFRSTLEADWAATLSGLEIRWQYEPEGIELPSGLLYRPDFYLPQLSTWLEVKGPHNERINKTIELAEAVMHHPDCPQDFDPFSNGCSKGCWWDPWQLVIIGEAPVADQATFRLANDGDEAAWLAGCTNCAEVFFCGVSRSYRCRFCSTWEGDHHLTICDTTFKRVLRERSA